MIPSGATIAGQHTYDDLGMIAKKRLTFAPPVPRTAYIDIPWSNGLIDNSELLTDSVTYQNRTGSFEFLVVNGTSYTDTYSALLNLLHGQKVNVILDDDPDYYYTGRMQVNEFYSREMFSTIVLDYNMEPFKHSIDTTGDIDWLWNDLFSNIIYYGTFDVDGSKARNLINPTSYVLTPTFTCSATMFVDFGSDTYTLPAGETTLSGIQLQPGDNSMTFRGTGRVLVDYDQGLSL